MLIISYEYHPSLAPVYIHLADMNSKLIKIKLCYHGNMATTQAYYHGDIKHMHTLQW